MGCVIKGHDQDRGWGSLAVVATAASGFSISINPKRGWLPSSQILASCPKRPIWKLPCWEVWPAGPLSVTHTQAPEQGWVIPMLFTLILDPSVPVSVHVYLYLFGGIFHTEKATPW